METPHIQTFGSFFRNGKYPLEANYIFESEESLKQWEQDNKKYLHEGLFKVVVADDKQTLYWYCDETFKPLLESDSLENLAMVLKDFELHGQLRDILRDFKNSYESKLKSIQQELDLTQSGAGLNGDGSFDTLNMKNTTYLEGSNSIIEALKALDRELSNVVADAFIKDAYYDSGRESIIITFFTKQEKEKTIEINVANLIREWEPDNTHPSKVVELVREETYSGGPDKLSADVRLSSRKDNILEKDSNTLLVRGTTDNLTHKGENLEKILDKIDLIPFLERIDKIEKSAQDWDNTKDSLTPNFAITLLTDNEEAFNISILGSARNLPSGYYYNYGGYYYQGIDLYGEWDIDTINNEIEN